MKSDSKVIETILLWLGIFSVIWFIWVLMTPNEKPACMENVCGSAYVRQHGYCPRVKICYRGGKMTSYPY